MATKKRKTVRQTGDRVSRIAARVLQAMQQDDRIHGRTDFAGAYVTAHELMALAASCLSQDQTKGRLK